MERPTDPIGLDIHDLYAHYGVAMYAAQCVERQIVILAPMLLDVRPQLTTRRELGELLDRLFGQTMGRTLSELARVARLPPGFEDRLKRALELRNHLAHNYFWERAGELATESGRIAMREELAEAAEFMLLLDEELMHAGAAWRRAVGVSDAVIAEELQRLTRGAPAV